MVRIAPRIDPRIRPQHRTVRVRLPAWEIAVSLLGTVLIPRLEARLRRAVIARQRVFHRGCASRFSSRTPQWASASPFLGLALGTVPALPRVARFAWAVARWPASQVQCGVHFNFK